jgi:hypothetical protein
MKRLIKLFMAISLCALLLACGTDSSSGGSSSGGAGAATKGVTVTSSSGDSPNGSNFSLRVTDAPIDNLVKVVIQFTAIEMKLQTGKWFKYTLPAPQPINLLSLQGLTTADLLVNMPIKPGDYKQLRFIVDDAPMANHVEEVGGGVKNLDIPNGSTVGLKIKQKFTIPGNRQMNFTVDFDLRKSVKRNRTTGLYRLKPKMRFAVDTDVGLVRGVIAPLLLIDPTCSDSNVDTHNAAYVYDGHNIVPDDINELSLLNLEPVTTTTINYDPVSGLYKYEATFLPAGDYTIAFTCNSNLEDLEADDDLKFFQTTEVTVLVTDTLFLKP